MPVAAVGVVPGDSSPPLLPPPQAKNIAVVKRAATSIMYLLNFIIRFLFNRSVPE
jgi:hypothetical protein